MKKIFVLIIALGLILAGCSTVSEQMTYILPTPNVSIEATVSPGKLIFFDRVQISDFLSKQGLVVEQGRNRVVVARQHRWAESLDEGIRRYTSRRLSEYGTEFRVSSSRGAGSRKHEYQLNLVFDSFHSIHFSEAVGSGHWILQDLENETVLTEVFFDLSKPNISEDYEGIVDALAGILDELSKEIALEVDRVLD